MHPESTASAVTPARVALADLADILAGPPFLTNRAFLAALLPARPVGESFWVAAFKADPNGDDAKWWGWPVEDDHGPSELPVHNNYFAVATIKVAGDARPSRRKDRFGRLFVVPLDDPEGALPLAPTYVLQTSPRKRQAGYRLRNPITDPKIADRLMQEMVRSGRIEKVDAGGCNITRYIRLPVGCNSKASHVEANGGEPFVVQLVEWRPERAYAVEEMAHGFALDLDYIEGRKQRASDARRKRNAAAGTNTVITALRARGLYKNALGDGKHDISCPWREHHTDGIDSGTAYFEPSEEHPRGGFRCLHGHCADRHLKDLCTFLGIEEPGGYDATGRPIIYLRAGVRDAIVDEAAAGLAENDECFARGTILCTPATVRESGIRSAVERSPDQIIILPHNASRMLNTLARSLAFLGWDGDAYKPTEPPFWLAQALIDDPRRWGPIRQLAGVTSVPLLMPDGSIHDAPGYHPGTAMFYQPRGDVAPIPESCSQDEARAALDRFTAWLKHYPFADESHRAAVVAMALAGLARHLLPITPYLHIDAPRQGSGKTLIAEAIGLIATGVRPPIHGYPTDPQETRKLLTSCLLAGDRVIVFDNAKDGRVIDDEELGKVVTSEKHGDRLLGTNDRTKLENLAIIIGTGNNNVLAGDLPRRALMPRIVPDVERPEERAFPWKPTDYVTRHRSEVVRDGLTVLRAYLHAERPGERALSPWGSFESFDLIRGALVWLGMPDPAGARARTQMSEAVAAEDAIFMLLWRFCEATQRRSFTVRSVMENCQEAPAIEELLGEANAEELGHLLRNRKGQIRCGGLHVEHTSRRIRGSAVWELRGDPDAEHIADA